MHALVHVLDVDRAKHHSSLDCALHHCKKHQDITQMM